jgi:hypothetical protein
MPLMKKRVAVTERVQNHYRCLADLRPCVLMVVVESMSLIDLDWGRPSTCPCSAKRR